MAVEVITSVTRLEELAVAWDALWRRSPSATPFQSPHWLLPWWKRFGSDDPAVIVDGSHDGTLNALLPLYIVRDEDSGESLGMFLGTGNSDYLDGIVAPGASADEALGAMAALDCLMWDLQQLRPDSPLLTSPLPDGWTENVEEQDRCPILDLSGAGADFENLLSTHARKKLRYYRRSLEREGRLSFENPSEDTLDDFMGTLFDLHAARWKVRGLPGVLADGVVQDFHRDAARQMLRAGALRLHVMRLAGKACAVFYGFAHAGTVYYYLSGYDPSLERLSIGNLIVAHAIGEALKEGAHTFDFLRGAEQYKYAWGAVDRVNSRRQLFPKL